ncbi:hypothetical protein ACHAXR_008706 [Thalassiosira sp. AJA248-18]
MAGADESPCPTPTQCVFIEKNIKTLPPNYTIPCNENSIRALSKKNRVYILREFLLRNYYYHPSSLDSSSNSSIIILDVAGGRGDLSWLLQNVDRINSTIADPRTPNHRRLIKAVQFLLDHPEEAKVRSVEGLPTHQPLAKLLPSLLESSDASLSSSSEIMSGNNNSRVELISPKFLRIHVDNSLVETLRKTIVTTTISGDDDAHHVWDNYWEEEQCRVESNEIYYGGTAPKKAAGGTKEENNTTKNSSSSQITDSRLALEIFRSLDLIVGFHPDQATEASIDLALLLGIPFAVVPCCVFPGEFPDRVLKNGKRVRTHSEFVDYLCMKHQKIRKETLPFVETDTAKNVVLYMLKEDICKE